MPTGQNNNDRDGLPVDAYETNITVQQLRAMYAELAMNMMVFGEARIRVTDDVPKRKAKKIVRNLPEWF